MAIFYDITSWNEKPWYQTGGTRNKVILESPTNKKDYYFKTSLKKETLDYKYEFWSEIIASEIGEMLGFNMLRYDIAYNHDEIGCISESMVTAGKNKLTEGMSYLSGYDTTYNPEDKDSKRQYTFHFIRDALDYFQLGRFIGEIIKVIILDSIIGNGDRHQENWGIITEYTDVVKALQEIARKSGKSIPEKLLFSLFAITSKVKRTDAVKVVENLHLLMPGSFSQIYDSGSCLGRELSEEKVNQMLTDNTMIEAYIRKGVSEIHWEGKKLNHFDLIQKVKMEYPEQVITTIKLAVRKFDENKVRRIVEQIDLKLPTFLEGIKLPPERKMFIIKLVTLRVKKLSLLTS